MCVGRRSCNNAQEQVAINTTRLPSSLLCRCTKSCSFPRHCCRSLVNKPCVAPHSSLLHRASRRGKKTSIFAAPVGGQWLYKGHCVGLQTAKVAANAAGKRRVCILAAVCCYVISASRAASIRELRLCTQPLWCYCFKHAPHAHTLTNTYTLLQNTVLGVGGGKGC